MKKIFFITIAIIILIIIAIWMSPVMKLKRDNPTFNVTSQEQKSNTQVQTNEVKDTYIYTNHGFSIELPKGFTPNEIESEGGPSLSISMPKGLMVYVTNSSFWEESVIPSYTYITDEKIGVTNFKHYTYSGKDIYWFKQGKIGYEYHGDASHLNTFKFVGWPQLLNEYKKVTRINYSVEIPKDWNESPVNSQGCDWYYISNNTGDGHRSAGEISIAPTSCFNISTTVGKKEYTEKNGYYIVAYYDTEPGGTTSAETAETKEVYKRAVETFTVK